MIYNSNPLVIILHFCKNITSTMINYGKFFDKHFIIVDDKSIRMRPFEIKKLYMDEYGSSIGLNGFYKFLHEVKRITKTNNQYVSLCFKNCNINFNDEEEEKDSILNPYSIQNALNEEEYKSYLDEKLKLKKEKLAFLKQESEERKKQIEEERLFQLQLQNERMEAEKRFLTSLDKKIKKMIEMYTSITILEMRGESKEEE